MKKTLGSGAELDVTLAPFVVGHRLFKAVMAETETVRPQDDLMDVLKTCMARLLYSPRIEEAMWACMERATYNNRKVNAELFEDEKTREDFLEVAKEVVGFNLSPFKKGLVSLFMALANELSKLQKSKSDLTRPS